MWRGEGREETAHVDGCVLCRFVCRWTEGSAASFTGAEWILDVQLLSPRS